MTDQLMTPGWYLQPANWSYRIPNGIAALPAPRNDPLLQNSPWSASNGRILGLLAQGSAGLNRPPASGGILGALTASPEDQTSNIPYWLQTAMPFDLELGAPRAPAHPRPQPISPLTWDSPALPNLPALPSAHFDSSSPYWLRTALPSEATSDIFGVPRSPTEQLPNPAAQLWPAAARDASVPPMLPALLATFSSVSPNDGNLSSWQMPVGSNVEALASPELNSVSGHDFPAFGPNSPTSHYGRQLGDTLTSTWEPDRPATPAGAEHLALSDMWPIVPSGHPANRLWIRGPTGAEHDPRVISDVTPHNDWRPGARYASNSSPGQNWRAVGRARARPGQPSA